MVPHPGPQVAPRYSLEDEGPPRESWSLAPICRLPEELTGAKDLGLHPGFIFLGPWHPAQSSDLPLFLHCGHCELDTLYHSLTGNSQREKLRLREPR